MTPQNKTESTVFLFCRFTLLLKDSFFLRLIPNIKAQCLVVSFRKSLRSLFDLIATYATDYRQVKYLSKHAIYEGGIKSNVTNDVKCQLKVGLYFYLFQIVKIPSLHRYTNFQTFNPILEEFLIVFLGYTSKEV